MWRGWRWVSEIREWEQATQTQGYMMFFPWALCRTFQSFLWKDWVSLQGHRARVPWETSQGVVGLVSNLFRESLNCPVTQLVEWLTVNQFVAGSSRPGQPNNKSCFMKYVLLGILLGYGLSFVSPEFNDFIFYHFTIFCRELNLPDQIWIWMDKYIFYGRL